MPAAASTISPPTKRSAPASGEPGVGRLAEPFAPQVEALLSPYRAGARRRAGAVRARAPIPARRPILREMLRPQDRAVLVELHPEDGAALAERYNAVANLKVLRRDGWPPCRP